MYPTVTESLPDLRDETENVANWRLEELIRAGYPVYCAEQLATRNDIDLHVACEFVTVRHCPPETAALILL